MHLLSNFFLSLCLQIFQIPTKNMIKDLLKIIRYLVLSLVCVIFTMSLEAQNLGTYYITRTTDWNYESIYYGNNVTWNCSSNTDNSISQPTAIGFNFPYNGLSCKTFYVSSNGYIVLDTISSSLYSTYPYPRYATNSTPGCSVASTNNYAYNDSCTAFYQNNTNNFSAMAIAPFYSDLITYYNGSEPLNFSIKYEVSGTSPNRVLTVEWYLMQLKGYNWNIWMWNFNESFMVFQTKLYETSGTIEFWYAWNFVYPYSNLPTANKYVIGLNSAAYTSTLPNTNYILTDSVPGTTTFTGNINFLTANPYPDFYYHKITFSKPGADIGVSNIYPPNPDTCSYSAAQIIVDTLVNFGSQSLTFNSSYPLKVYTQITGVINTLDSGIFTGSFPSGGTIAVQMSNSVNMSGGGTYYLKSYTNSSIVTTTTTYTDQNLTNDTTTATFYVGSVSAAAARSTICSGDTTQLSATSTTFGHIGKITYSAPTMSSPSIPSPWTSNTIPDDGVSNGVSIGFNFYYFGKLRTTLYVSSNGNVQFSSAYNTASPLQFPSTLLPTEIIALAWADLKPNYAGVIQYQTIGTAPNREFVLKYAAVADTTSLTTLTAYLILHETTNIIEFQNGTIPSSFYNQGIEDSTGAINYGLGSRNANTWTASNDAYVLESQANYSWSPSASLSNAYIANPIASPTVTTTYTVTLNGGNPGYPDSTGVCPKTSTVTVNVNPGLGNLSHIVGDTILCSNMNASYQISAVTNASSYVWDVSNLAGSVITTGQGTDSITLTLGSTSGFIRVRAYNSSCNIYSSWDTLNITVEPNIYGPGQWVGGVSTDWFNIYNWCGGMPSSTVSAYIDGTYYTPLFYPVINGAGAVCQNLNIYGNNETFTINGSYNLDVYGSWYNGIYAYSSTFNANNSTVSFIGSSSLEYINGYVETTFNNITLNKGTDTTYVLQNAQGQTMSMTGNLNILNGLLMLEEPTSTIQFTNITASIPSTGGIQFDGGILSASNCTLTNYGLFRMGDYASDMAIGTTSGNSFITSGSGALTQIYGGNLTVASQMEIANGATFVFDDTYSNTFPNTISLNTVGTSSNTKALFDIDHSSSLGINSGTILFHQINSGTGKDLKIISGASKTINGGTFQFGDWTTPTSQTFKVEDSLVNFYDIYINSYNTPTLRLDAPATFQDILNLTHGILNLNHNILTVASTYNGAIIDSTTSPSGYILAEDTANLAGIKWLVAQNFQSYIFPFGNKYGNYIPFKFTNTSGPEDTVFVATYAPYTDSIAHLPYPPTVTQIRNAISNYPNDSANIVNRFWQINVTPLTNGTNTATITFTYGPNETHHSYAGMVGQRWNVSNTGWVSPNSNGGQSSNMINHTVTVTGVSHFSPWTLANSSQPLPIELVSFTANNENNKYVLTDWITASEINNDHFEIERSKDGLNFEFVGKIPGAGNSNQTLYYSLNDDAPLSGLSYYRLKQVDFNGDFTYSEIVPVQFNALQSVSIFPNPNDGNFTLSYNFTSQINNIENAYLQIFDITGRVVYSYSLASMKGYETIDASLLTNGIYYWEVISASGVFDKGKIAIMK